VVAPEDVRESAAADATLSLFFWLTLLMLIGAVVIGYIMH
jgi:hypothetical protein